MAQVGKSPIFTVAAGAGLCLHPPGCCPEGAACSTSKPTQLPATSTAKIFPAPQEQQRTPLRPLTIVYGDRACTVEVTEAQALEILSTARRGMEQSATVASGGNSKDLSECRPAPAAAAAGAIGSDCPRRGVLGQSMKGSLQRFLEKRAARLGNVACAPYATAAKTHSKSSLLTGIADLDARNC